MVCHRPKERITINEIKKHPWIKELFKTLGDYEQDEKIDINSNDKKKLLSPKKNKVKHLSHNPSFNKKESNNNNIDKKSNYSDGYNYLHINENKSENETNMLHICKDNYLKKNNLNNKTKEFEMKYLKELSLRKVNIDKLLKEQEDDID